MERDRKECQGRKVLKEFVLVNGMIEYANTEI